MVYFKGQNNISSSFEFYFCAGNGKNTRSFSPLTAVLVCAVFSRIYPITTTLFPGKYQTEPWYVRSPTLVTQHTVRHDGSLRVVIDTADFVFVWIVVELVVSSKIFKSRPHIQAQSNTMYDITRLQAMSGSVQCIKWPYVTSLLHFSVINAPTMRSAVSASVGRYWWSGLAPAMDD